MNCPLTGELDLSNTKVETIGKSAFSGCTGLTGVVLPETLKIMGDSDGSSGSVFNGCTGLKYVRTNGGKEDAVFELPGNLEVIGKQSFKGCTGFPANTTIIIPASVKIVGSEAFYNLDNITTIIIETNDARGYNSSAFKAGNYGFGYRMLIFNSYSVMKSFEGCSSEDGLSSYEFKLYYGDNSTGEAKLYGQPLSVCKDENGNWYMNENYNIPKAPEGECPVEYEYGWKIDENIITPVSNICPEGDEIKLEAGIVLKKPNIEFIVDGEKIECEGTYPELKLTNDKEHTIGVSVSHDIEKSKNPDVTVEFEYEWTDVWNGGKEGPRMKEDGFGRYNSVKKPNVKNTITINGAKDERTNTGNYSGENYGDGYYLLEIYGYSTPKDGGKRELFYKSASTVIASDLNRTVNTAYLFDVVTYTPEGGSSGGGSSSGGSGGGSYQESDIIGKDRYETAGLIADRIGYYNSVILVNANDTLADGLSAASLSGKESAPILLVKKDSIPKATMDRLYKAKTVYIIGGENAISKKVESQLKDKKVIRIGGKNRVETSLKLAEYVGNYDEAFIVNGYTGEADAMSASAVAAREVAPIILTNGKTSNYAKKSGVEYYAVGGKAVLDDKIVSKYDAERFGGDDRYETNRLIINEFYKYSSKYYFTKGDPLVDALTVSLHAKDNGVVLVSKKSDNSILKGKDIVQVGGMPFSIFPIK